MVLILSPRCPEPTCRNLSILAADSDVMAAFSSNLFMRSDLACSRLLILDLVCAVIVMPVGTWRRRQLAITLLRFCPPGPVPLNQVISRSSSRRTSRSRGSCDITATVTVLVCTRPRFSVGGTRWTLCPPASLVRDERSCPSTRRTNMPDAECSMVVSQPNRWHIRRYALARSWTNSLLSSPPSAARISMYRIIISS